MEPLHQTTIAVIFDFDRTLSKDYMQHVIFEKYGIDGEKFWRDHRENTAKLREQGIPHVNDTLRYINKFLKNIQNGTFSGLSNSLLRELGQHITLYPGLPEFFGRMKTLLSPTIYKRFNVRLEFYIMTTGFTELVRGSVIAPHLADVWGFEFEENKKGEIEWVTHAMSGERKVNLLYGINKGEEDLINRKVAHEMRRIPFDYMIYVGDGTGDGDIPPFSLIKERGGKSFAIYNPEMEKTKENAQSLQKEGKVDDFGPGDYRPESKTAQWIERAILHIADTIVAKREKTLEKYVGKHYSH